MQPFIVPGTACNSIQSAHEFPVVAGFSLQRSPPGRTVATAATCFTASSIHAWRSIANRPCSRTEYILCHAERACNLAVIRQCTGTLNSARQRTGILDATNGPVNILGHATSLSLGSIEYCRVQYKRYYCQPQKEGEQNSDEVEA